MVKIGDAPTDIFGMVYAVRFPIVAGATPARKAPRVALEHVSGVVVIQARRWINSAGQNRLVVEH